MWNNRISTSAARVEQQHFTVLGFCMRICVCVWCVCVCVCVCMYVCVQQHTNGLNLQSGFTPRAHSQSHLSPTRVLPCTKARDHQLIQFMFSYQGHLMRRTRVYQHTIYTSTAVSTQPAGWVDTDLRDVQLFPFAFRYLVLVSFGLFPCHGFLQSR